MKNPIIEVSPEEFNDMLGYVPYRDCVIVFKDDTQTESRFVYISDNFTVMVKVPLNNAKEFLEEFTGHQRKIHITHGHFVSNFPVHQAFLAVDN